MIVRDACPACGSTRCKKNGRTHNGKQNHQCKACPRQFVRCAEAYRISDETRALIERLLRERISLRGICQIPPDLVVQYQAIDIVGVIFSLIWRLNLVHT
jgi:transposase-like protein